MHKDAELNYSTKWGFNQPAPDVSTWTDKEVVLTLWGNTRYMEMKHNPEMSKQEVLDKASPELRQIWSDFRAAHSTPDGWNKLRRRFEENGWHGSPTSQ